MSLDSGCILVQFLKKAIGLILPSIYNIYSNQLFLASSIFMFHANTECGLDLSIAKTSAALYETPLHSFDETVSVSMEIFL